VNSGLHLFPYGDCVRRLIMILILPSIAVAGTGSSQSETGSADTRSPRIDLISPTGPSIPPGNTEFQWTLEEDSLSLEADAVSLRVREDGQEIFSVSMPMIESEVYSQNWDIPIGTDGVLTWEVEGRDYFGNESLELSEAMIVTSLPSDPTLPSSMTLLNSWPNPFNPSTRIRFAIPVEGDVILRIHDLSGNLVETLFQGRLDAGWHEFAWDSKGVSSGVYFATLKADSQTRSTKLVLVK